MHVISYAHMRDGVLYHGTLSDLDGAPKATWSYEKGGKKVTHDLPLDAPTFRSLWNRVGNLDVFKRNRVRDPDRPVNPEADHVVTIMFGEPNKPQQAHFAIPADEADPQFLSWIKSLNIPKGSTKPASPPELPRKGTEVSPNTAERERVYAKFFGNEWQVDRDDDPDGPPIDVYIFEPQEARGLDRPCYTLVTSGMSDKRMRVPKEIDFRRAELLLYVNEPTDEHIGVLRFLARLPHQQKTTWYAGGTTMTNGQPPQPIFEDSELACYLFLDPPLNKDDEVHKKLEIDDDAVAILWVVPITDAECQYIIDRNLGDFLELLDRKEHPFVLDEGRRSYVKSRR
jgi:hypothetical protein